MNVTSLFEAQVDALDILMMKCSKRRKKLTVLIKKKKKNDIILFSNNLNVPVNASVYVYAVEMKYLSVTVDNLQLLLHRIG